MRCRQCDYPLWGLAARSCPECGTDFAPSQYELTPGAVRFLCPSCSQQYFGTTPEGHLEPRSFECVSCARTIDMDEMVLEPVAGWESRAVGAPAPWVDPARKSTFTRLFATIGWSMITPGRLIEGVPVESSAWRALGFALLANTLYTICAFGLMLVLMLATGGVNALPGLLLFMGIMVVAVMVLLMVWVCITHGLLVITGGAPGGFVRTLHAIAYSSGANVLTAVPCCMGSHMLGAVWWAIAAPIMVAYGHSLRGIRPVMCTLALPLLVMVGFGGMIAWSVMGAAAPIAMPAPGGPGGPGGTWPQPAAPTTPTSLSTSAASLAAAFENYAWDNAEYPAHVGELLLDWEVALSDFAPSDMNADPIDATIGSTPVFGFGALPADEQRRVLDNAIGNMPDRTIAYRVGCFVFTHHGIDPTADPAELWIFVNSVQPGTSQVIPGGVRMVGLVDGTVVEIGPDEWADALASQNGARATIGLAPLEGIDAIEQGMPLLGPPVFEDAP